MKGSDKCPVTSDEKVVASAVSAEIASIDRQIGYLHRDLCGLRNKYRKSDIERKLADLRARRAELLKTTKEAA